MKHVYSILFKKTSLMLLSGIISTLSFAQTSPCGPIVENFNNNANGMAGFSSSTVNSQAPGFTFNAGQGGNPDGDLRRCGIPSGGTVYELTTPTYRTLNSQTAVGYGFELSGAVVVSRVVVILQYIDNTGMINSVEVANFAPSYTGPSGGIATECRSIAIASYPGFDPGDAYRLIFQFTAASASNNNQCIVFDDFRTTGAGSQAPLPVSFTNFSVRKLGAGVQAAWNVAGEKDVLKYEIERSTNGRDFTKIGEVAATGGNTGYLFTDAQPVNGVAFYRVRNIDLDGKFKYTQVARLNLSKVIALRAFPQPAKNEVTIEHGNVSGKGMITVNSADGRRVLAMDVKPDMNQTTINITTLKPGLYIVRFDNGAGQAESLKIVKQ